LKSSLLFILLLEAPSALTNILAYGIKCSKQRDREEEEKFQTNKNNKKQHGLE
jgi:hypothetical protein